MFARVCFAVVALACVSSPAFAAGQCDSTAPMVPAIPSSAEISASTIAEGQAKLNNIFSDLHIYQKQLKGYRDCLNAAIAADKAEAGRAASKRDNDGVTKSNAAFMSDTTAYNATIDAEQQIANAINADVKAHCARDQSDFCKPKN
jgi:hypothetical protein